MLLPLVYVVFMPMRANVHEVDAFVELCARACAWTGWCCAR